MKAQVLKIQKQKSKRTGYFYYVFFKSIPEGKSYRSCVGTEFRNFGNWTGICPGMVLDNLEVRGKMVDADSQPVIRLDESTLEEDAEKYIIK